MPRECGASSNHCAHGGYWVPRLRGGRQAAAKDVDARANRGRDDTKTPATLLNLRRDLLQDLDKFLAVARADDMIEIALMPASAARQRGEHFFSRWRDIQSIRSPVAVHAPAFDKATAHQIFDDRREAGLVAAVGLRQLRLTDAGVAGDQRQGGEPSRAFADFLRPPREGLERGFLR